MEKSWIEEEEEATEGELRSVVFTSLTLVTCLLAAIATLIIVLVV